MSSETQWNADRFGVGLIEIITKYTLKSDFYEQLLGSNSNKERVPLKTPFVFGA